MQSFDRAAILERKAQLEAARQDVQNEFYRLAGAVQFCDSLLAELDAALDNNSASRVWNPQNEAGNVPANGE